MRVWYIFGILPSRYVHTTIYFGFADNTQCQVSLATLWPVYFTGIIILLFKINPRLWLSEYERGARSERSLREVEKKHEELDLYNLNFILSIDHESIDYIYSLFTFYQVKVWYIFTGGQQVGIWENRLTAVSSWKTEMPKLTVNVPKWSECETHKCPKTPYLPRDRSGWAVAITAAAVTTRIFRNDTMSTGNQSDGLSPIGDDDWDHGPPQTKIWLDVWSLSASPSYVICPCFADVIILHWST